MTAPAIDQTALPAWVIIADGEIDQICGSAKEARKEVRDLKRMGCEARSKRFPNWPAAQDYADGFTDRA